MILSNPKHISFSFWFEPKLFYAGTLILLLLLTSFKLETSKPELDQTEAQKAFLLLNKIRLNPNEYSKQLKFQAKNVVRTQLVWNSILAQVAEEKAMDMAKGNYFSHVNKKGEGINILIYRAGYQIPKDWFKKKNSNFFESISAGDGTGEKVIQSLIIDNGVPSLGHRKHLLGLDEWNANLQDVGIGFVRGTSGNKYVSYTCVIIAKHEF